MPVLNYPAFEINFNFPRIEVIVSYKMLNACKRVMGVSSRGFPLPHIGDAQRRKGKGSKRIYGYFASFQRILCVSLELVTGATIRRLNEKLPLLAAVNAYTHIRLVPFCYLRETSRSGVRSGSANESSRGELLRRSYGLGGEVVLRGGEKERGRSLPPPQRSYCFNPWRPSRSPQTLSPCQPSLLHHSTSFLFFLFDPLIAPSSHQPPSFLYYGSRGCLRDGEARRTGLRATLYSVLRILMDRLRNCWRN